MSEASAVPAAEEPEATRAAAVGKAHPGAAMRREASVSYAVLGVAAAAAALVGAGVAYLAFSSKPPPSPSHRSEDDSRRASEAQAGPARPLPWCPGAGGIEAGRRRRGGVHVCHDIHKTSR